MTESTRDAYFALLVAQYEALGLIGLGKMPDPATRRETRELGRTQVAIDVLEMLERKTRGNLTAEEEGELRRVLTLLRINYAAEATRPAEAEAGAPEAGSPAGGDSEPAAPEPGPGAGSGTAR